MAGLGQRLLGAAIAGAGAGILSNAKQKREDMLLRLQRQWQTEDRAASEALTREGWDRADARAAEGRAQALALAGAKADMPPKPTSEQQNIAAFLERNPGKTEADYFAMKRAPGTTVITGDQAPARPMSAVYDPQTRTEPSKDHVFDYNPQTGTINRDERGLPIEVPRGKAATKAEELAEKAAGRQESVQRQASLATTHIDAIRGILDKSPNVTTGVAGAFLSQIPSTAAHDLDRRVDTLKAMIGFNALNEMRANSPTGGALGNVTERELALLQSTVASLELSQSRDQFMENLALVEEQFNRVIHGPQAGEQQTGAPDAGLTPAPDVALPPPETVEPLSAPAPDVSAPVSETGAGRFANMGQDELLAILGDTSAKLSDEDMDAIDARLEAINKAFQKAISAI